MVVDFNDLGAKLLSPLKLAHVVLRTNQLDKIQDFCVTILGGRYSLQVPNLSFLTYDDEHHRIALVTIPDIKAKDRNTNDLEVRKKALQSPQVNP
jgi:catechol-2,3-dioxygenase